MTIKDISNHLGVSYGIINKALNNKSGISEEMRAKILKTADELGYRVNKVAQSMARNTITIGIVIPTVWEEYFQILQSGIDAEFERLQDYNVQCRYYKIDNIYSSVVTRQMLEKCMEDEVHGVILCDVFPNGLTSSFDALASKNIPVVLIGGSEYPDDKYLCSVQVDAYRSGVIAAELLSISIGGENSNTAIFVGNKDNSEHRLKIKGFADSLDKFSLNLIGVYETHDDETIATHLTQKITGENENVAGIYFATSNIASVSKTKTKIVGTDINTKIAGYMKDGIVQYSLYQNPEKLGKTAVRLLYEYIADHKEPEKSIYISPQIVVSSNVEEYIIQNHD